MQHLVQTSDARTLAVSDTGGPPGRTIMVHMGTPNWRELYRPNVVDAAARGIRLISYDRPGYGGSSPQAGRSVADCATDVQAICQALGIDRLAMWGYSGGGPHLLACAALLPDLVAAAACLASIAPFDVDGLDWFAGMGEGNVEDTRLMLSDEPAAREKSAKDQAELLHVTADELAASLESVLSPTDAAALDGELAEYLAAVFRNGSAPGSHGWWDDSVAHLRPWGFDLADIRIPVLLLHGEQDRFVPFGHGRWLAEHIPGVSARLFADDGHLTLLQNRIGEVHAWLAEFL